MKPKNKLRIICYMISILLLLFLIFTNHFPYFNKNTIKIPVIELSTVGFYQIIAQTAGLSYEEVEKKVTKEDNDVFQSIIVRYDKKELLYWIERLAEMKETKDIETEIRNHFSKEDANQIISIFRKYTERIEK